jgi:RNA polymerase sigma factor (sigma-70 family)
VRSDNTAAEVAQETMLVAWRQLDTLRDPAAFGGWVLRTARNKALNRLEREQRSTPTDDTSAPFATLASDDDVAAAVTQAEAEAMVWAAAATLGERDASVLDLHLRHGLSAAEIGDELGVNANLAHQLLFRMKKRLAAGIRAYVVFRRGDPSCAELASALDAAGVRSFGRDAVRVIDRHVADCGACTAAQAAVLAPEALFAAAPVLVMAPSLRAAMATALRGEGVPLGPGADAAHAPAEVPDRLEEVGDDDVERADGADDLGGLLDGLEDEADGDPTSSKRRGLLLALAAVVLVASGVGVAARQSGTDDREVVLAQGSEPGAARASTTAPSSAREGDGTTPTIVRSGTTSTTRPADAPPPTVTPGLTPPTSQPDQAPPAPSAPGFAPPTSPPATAPPTTAPPATTTTAPPAPTVGSFTATSLPNSGQCPAGQFPTNLAWTTAHATSARITANLTDPLEGLPPNGSAVACRTSIGPPPGGWTLTATGPGGSTTASA